MICLSCQQLIKDNLDSCPYCHAHLNAEKLRFIKYIGDVDNLVGYQKSYKLVLLQYIIEFMRLGQELSVDSIMCRIKEFYLNRVRGGLVADYDVDDRIQNISENTTVYDIWSVFKANPYNALNNQGFLFLEKNQRGELIFVLHNDIVDNLSSAEQENLCAIIRKKLNLYYSKYGEQQASERLIIEPTVITEVKKIENVELQQDQALRSAQVDARDIPLEQTYLSVRSKHCLMRKGYKTVGDILDLNEESLFRIRNVGRKSVDEICELIELCCNGLSVHEKSLVSGEEIKLDEISLECALRDTRLGGRAKNVLEREGYRLVGDIVNLTEEELLSFHNVGILTVREIIAFINKIRSANGMGSTDDESSVLLKSIKSTTLSNRAKNVLINAGLQVVGDMLDLTAQEVWDLPGIGDNTIEEILQYSIALKEKLAEEEIEDNRQEYQVLQYPYKNISPECEELPVIVLSYFGMKPSLIRKLQGGGINKLGQLKSMKYCQIQIALGVEWSKLLLFTLQEFNDGAIVATKTFLDTISREEDLCFILERSRGATLQEIGNKHGMTREGIRQCIEKPLKYIKPMAVGLAKALIAKQANNYLAIQDVYDVYDNDTYDAILSYALKESEEIESIEALGLFLVKGTISYNDLLSDAIREYVGEGVFWQRNISELMEILQEKNISFVELDDVWLYMLSMGYRVYGEYVAPTSVSYGVLLSIVVEEDFPEGIVFSDTDAMGLLRKRAYERFGNLNLPEDDRPVIARLNDYLILCDRGKWIAPNRVVVDISTLELIKEFIDQSEENIIYYQALFNQFEGLLAMTSDISNYHYLHGVLRYYYKAEYTFDRDSLSKEGAVNGRLSQRIYDYIVKRGEAVSRKELKEYLKITSDVMIVNVVNTNMEIFPWEFNYYNCLGNISVTPTEREFFHEIIAEIFADNKNYCSAKMLYDYSLQVLPDCLERNHIKNATNLFYMLAAILGKKYKCRFPHILPYDSVLSGSEDIARKFVADAKRLNKNQFNALFDKFGWGQSTVGLIFENIVKEDEYYRVSRTEYIRKNEFNLTEEQRCRIRDCIENCISNKPFIGCWEINYSKFPEVGYEWTPYLLETCISYFVKEYRFITTVYGSNKAERGLCVPNDSAYYTFDEIVVGVMKGKGYKRLTENEMFTLLVLSGVIKNSVPNELKDSKLITFNEGMYELGESA